MRNVMEDLFGKGKSPICAMANGRVVKTKRSMSFVASECKKAPTSRLVGAFCLSWVDHSPRAGTFRRVRM